MLKWAYEGWYGEFDVFALTYKCWDERLDADIDEIRWWEQLHACYETRALVYECWSVRLRVDIDEIR